MKRLSRPLAALAGLLSFIFLLLPASPAVAQTGADGVMSITTDSESALQSFLTARDHLNNVEINAAREALDAALEADPEFVLALAYRARIAESGDAHIDLMRRVEQGLSSVSKGERLLISAMKKQREGKTRPALKNYKKLAKTHPNDADAQLMLGAMYLNMQDYDRSLDQLTRATEIDPAFAAAYNLLGYRAMYAGDNQAAEAAFKKYVELRPTQANPYDSIAEFYMKQGRFTEAVDSYRKAFLVDDRYVAAKARAGVALALGGDTEAARSELRDALSLTEDPADKTDIYSSLSNTYLLDDDIDGAIRVLNEGIKWVEPVSPHRAAFLTLAKSWIYSENNQNRKAEQMIGRVQAGLNQGRYPADIEPYLRSRLRIGRTMVAINNNEFDKAETHIAAFARYVDATGGTRAKQQLHELKAMKAYATDDFDLAIKHMTQAGDEAHVQYHLGQMYVRAQNSDMGLKHLRRAAIANEGSRSFALVRNRALQAINDGK